ncbi:Patatin-like serine hydrolase, putative [Talaromyces stipitatus ATCC 10500]|uniref:Lysophospholipase NTE1 n=1 Tax=Talaromyces stipitatus (strain ATCC 10500 / CBS 375.48 / QM 6759 / NRRL 1006) TaxID=441959 RepID=B8MP74_TALSN|nr:Patatin-like serine hydrolase, putative [Talaromyces stipitatus ATCC 10500]EED14313.1 Patatin-like serine hydrolase, putative [Talaromyces stipitatus ATCC 10500]
MGDTPSISTSLDGALSLPTSLLSISSAVSGNDNPSLSSSSLLSATTASTMALRTLPAVPPPVETAMPGALGQVLVFVLHTIPSILFWVIGFATITIPTWLFTLFSMSLTFTMNFTTLMVIFAAFMSTVIWFIRYRYLNMYSRLPPEPQRKEPQIDLFPDTQEGDSKPGLANYLDEFLSAIKVFGYLERPVFHELTRTMQTRKLMAGETLLLEEEKGFCLVVDGLVQIFVKSIRGNESNPHASTFGMEDTDDEELHRMDGNQGYQLLTEVKNGASMSSLFSILTLFTEDVHLRQGSDDSTRNVSEKSLIPPSIPGSPGGFVPGPQLGSPPADHTADGLGVAPLPTVPPLDLEDSAEQTKTAATSTADQSPQTPAPSSQPQGRRHANKNKSVHPDIVARAMVDTTIAIIPASAFRRLTRMYPRATAHIVQVILTRLQRVTFSTAHSYLGLDTEVLSIDRQLNKFTAHDLPNDLRGRALERLKDKFRQERERLGPKDDSKGIALHNPQAHRRRRSSSSLRKDAALQTKIAASRRHLSMSNENFLSSNITHASSGTSPGDLLSTIQLNRYGNRSDIGHRPPSQGQGTPFAEVTSPLAQVEHSPFRGGSMHMATSPFLRREAVDEDSIFRESVVECMMKGIGLTSSTRDALQKTYSGEQSPKLVSYDSRRQKAVFNNAFGFMDPFDDAESESMMSMSVTSAGGTSPVHNLREELRSEIEIVSFPQGSVLVEQGERNPGLYYVIDGFLDVGVPVNDRGDDLVGTSKESDESFPTLKRTTTSSSRVSHADPKRRKYPRRSLYLIKPGGMQGYVGSVASYRSFTDVVAKTDVYVGFLPRATLERIAERYPIVLLTLAKRLTSVLPRLILHIDFALEWVQVNAGQVIHHQGDDSDAIYIVLNGRLRSVLEGKGGKIRVLGEYGQGESVGELEVMTESTRPATLHAIRDTELAKFPRSLFNSLAQEHPGITIQISKLIAQRMRDLVYNPLVTDSSIPRDISTANTATSTVNMRTVAILPVTMGVPVVEFGNRLMNAFTQIGVTNGVTSLNQAAILNHLGRHAFSKMGKLKLAQYLADLEEKYGMVLYIADTNVNSPWTQTCITQADCILLVGLAEGSPSIGEYERFLLGMKTTARKELVLLHAERYCRPGLTRRWLKNRMWINGGHHHVQMSYRLTTEPANPRTKRFGTALKQRVQVIQAEIQKYTSRRIHQTPLYSQQTPFKGDFHRLARRLCGKSVGLVLGGGGARGIAHVGVIKAIEEAGIPIDIVGGTSIGSFIGALYARDADVVPMYGRAKKFAGRMGSIWRFALDLTYPAVSYTTGHEFNRGIFKTFGDSQIEDFWLEFYCNTTNISKSRNEFHSSGYVWRYVRASMSLAGLLPPLCDEGCLLLDGGYVDNLTVAHMKSLGADIILAVDVGSLDDNTPQDYGDTLSGFWTFANRWNPFSSTPNPITLSEIQARLAYVSSVDSLERAKNMPGCLYMRPPIDPYGTLEFGKFDEIYEVGYSYGKRFLDKLRAEGSLPVLEESTEEKKLRRTMAPRRASV